MPQQATASGYHYELGPIRPPSEAHSLLVRVSRNCPWNRCRFCTTYRGTTFEARKPEDVMQDIDRMAKIAEILTEIAGDDERITRTVMEEAFHRGLPPDSAYQVALFLAHGGRNVFLQDANSLDIDKGEMEAILLHLRRRFPRVTRVTTYARSMTLKRLGSEVLRRFREAGLTRVHVGLESGDLETLKRIHKGVGPRQHIEGGRAAKEAGLELSEYVMPGVAGRERSEMHARETARVLNAIDPDFIRLRTFFPLPGSGLADDLAAGRVTAMKEPEIVSEIRILVRNLEGIESRLVSDHDRNLLPELEGRLPDDRAEMLAVLDRYLDLPQEEKDLFLVGRRLGHFRPLDDLENAASRPLIRKVMEDLRRRYGDVETGLYRSIEVHM